MEKIKQWFKKNKTAIIAAITSFAAGVAAAFSVFSRRSAASNQYIRELKDRLDEYGRLNNELERLNDEFNARLENLTDSNKKLTEQNSELRRLNRSTKYEIAVTRDNLNEASRAIDSGISTVDQISEIGERIRGQSERLRAGIDLLEQLYSQSTDDE